MNGPMASYLLQEYIQIDRERLPMFLLLAVRKASTRTQSENGP